MANTYKKVYVHIIFAVQNRSALLGKEWRHELFAYISGILNKRGHMNLIVGGYNDHIHILFSYSLKESITDLVREIKKASTKYISDNNLSKHKFTWQSGYAAFSVGQNHKDRLFNYIANQEQHHKKKLLKKKSRVSLKIIK